MNGIRNDTALEGKNVIGKKRKNLGTNKLTAFRW
jgi:hypothetical protein